MVFGGAISWWNLQHLSVVVSAFFGADSAAVLGVVSAGFGRVLGG